MAGIDIRNQKIGFLVQSDWDTVHDATANFQTIKMDAGVMIPDFGVIKEEFNETSAYGVMAEQGRIYTDATTGLKKLPFSFTARQKCLKPLLAAWFGTVTESASTPYTATYSPNDNVNGSPLNYGDGEAVLLSVAVGNYNNGSDTGDGVILQNAIIDDLTIKIPSGRDTGMDTLMKVSGTFVGNKILTNQYFSGTWVAPVADTYFSGFSLNTLTVNGVDYSGVCLRSAELTFKNNVQGDCVTTQANDYLVKPEIMYNIVLYKTSVSQAVAAQYIAGSNVVVDIRNGTPTTDGKIAFANTIGELMDNPYGVDGDRESVILSVKVLRPTAGWGNLCTMSDTVDWSL